MKNIRQILESLFKEINDCEAGLFTRQATLEGDFDEIICIKNIEGQFLLTQLINFRKKQEKIISNQAFQKSLEQLVEIGVGEAPDYDADDILDGEILTIILKHPSLDKTLYNSFFYGELPENAISKKVINQTMPIVRKLLHD